MWNLKKKKWCKGTYLQNRNRGKDVENNSYPEKKAGRSKSGDWN